MLRSEVCMRSCPILITNLASAVCSVQCVFGCVALVSYIETNQAVMCALCATWSFCVLFDDTWPYTGVLVCSCPMLKPTMQWCVHMCHLILYWCPGELVSYIDNQPCSAVCSVYCVLCARVLYWYCDVPVCRCNAMSQWVLACYIVLRWTSCSAVGNV